MTSFIPANPPGEMARRIREMDWSLTALGSSATWPQSLRLSVAMILASSFPMAIRWGPELILIYNDAHRPILRDKHPEALGRPLREVWWEVYSELGPLNEAILRGRPPLDRTATGNDRRGRTIYAQLQPDSGRSRSERYSRRPDDLR